MHFKQNIGHGGKNRYLLISMFDEHLYHFSYYDTRNCKQCYQQTEVCYNEHSHELFGGSSGQFLLRSVKDDCPSGSPHGRVCSHIRKVHKRIIADTGLICQCGNDKSLKGCNTGVCFRYYTILYISSTKR